MRRRFKGRDLLLFAVIYIMEDLTNKQHFNPFQSIFLAVNFNHKQKEKEKKE